MTIQHNLGFPRIGAQRELKRALEQYWRGDSEFAELEQLGQRLRAQHWQQQAAAGVELLPVGDFSWYDQVLDMSATLGVVPQRFHWFGAEVDITTYFRMARGRAPGGEPVNACEMTKWFDTNYHYIVPELVAEQKFKLSSNKLFNEVAEAQALGFRVKPVLLGPLSYLWLAKGKGADFDKLQLLEALLPVYGEILQRLERSGVEWVQMDEPILALDLPQAWRTAFEAVYTRLQSRGIKQLLTTYFGPLRDNLTTLCRLPVAGIHIDAVRAPEEVAAVLSWLPNYKVLSLGVVDGRNIWRSDLAQLVQWLAPLKAQLGERLWIAPSCSLLHVPVDLAHEVKLEPEIKSWLAFALQKLDELAVIKRALCEGVTAVAEALDHSARLCQARKASRRIHKTEVKARLEAFDEALTERDSPYSVRSVVQQAWLKLPLFPTTTIGSFPQTAAIRQIRQQYKQGGITPAVYQASMREEIAFAVGAQEQLGLDVLVHGEAERNDMVEYFGEQLEGFAFTQNGWVQSYGSRCVKPPIIYGDVSRPAAMTVEWARYAQSLTKKPMKGMLTGPVTILNWSFVRDDQPRATSCLQIAFALRDEVADLERAGIKVIQIDEAALREGLPLRQADWQHYLDWAVRAFKVTAAVVADETQIHTHMCYSEFNDIMAAIAAMDADVITIETSRSDMELLEVFERFHYPNGIGPGVYDIHTPNVPTIAEMVLLMQKATAHIAVERLWVNPDCGLKTRQWPEVDAALQRMVAAAHSLRQEYGYQKVG